MTTTGTRIAARKEQRAHAREIRAAFTAALSAPARAALEQALAERVVPHLGSPGILGSYAPAGSEIAPAAVERAARALGWLLAFPRVTGPQPLDYHLAGPEDLVPGFRGIFQPPEDRPAARPDVVLVPLLEADRRGHRLGQGGGHYDRTLASLRSSGPLLAIGLAWDVQIVPAIEAEPWDQPLDAIATPSDFHHAGAAARRTG
ncbi:5-formyltetrahydrofolate cyclo-ligase [Sandaracinobacteroides sp. A072]|uniref:5-formyltetrahydrofolate cyclo-ligase n=1 Tax=Sandaracinobacteroides sp. A072 TaxID=3461146 RepID=UPI0040430D65